MAVVLAAFELPGFRIDGDAFTVTPVTALLEGVALSGELCGGVQQFYDGGAGDYGGVVDLEL